MYLRRGFFKISDQQGEGKGGSGMERERERGFLLFRKYLVVGLPLFVRLLRVWVGCWRWRKIANRCETKLLSRTPPPGEEGGFVLMLCILDLGIVFENSGVFTWDSSDRACCRSCAQPVPVEADMLSL